MLSLNHAYDLLSVTANLCLLWVPRSQQLWLIIFGLLHPWPPPNCFHPLGRDWSEFPTKHPSCLKHSSLDYLLQANVVWVHHAPQSHFWSTQFCQSSILSTTQMCKDQASKHVQYGSHEQSLNCEWMYGDAKDASSASKTWKLILNKFHICLRLGSSMQSFLYRCLIILAMIVDHLGLSQPMQTESFLLWG